MYNAINSSIDAFRGQHDTAGSMTAGALTGALFRATCESPSTSSIVDLSLITFQKAGVRPALVSATIVSGAAGVWSLVKKSV
jgi:mitochondrial import inner membrane translocase subunit TIM23